METRRSGIDPTRGKKGIHSLDLQTGRRLCAGLTVSNPGRDQIVSLLARARCDLPEIASDEVVLRVVDDNPDCFWAMQRKTAGGRPAEPAGFAMFLMLNDNGLDALISGRLVATDPAPEWLVAQHEKPAAIYVWLVHAKGRVVPGLSLVMEKLQSPSYRDVDLVARAVTKEGSQFNDSLGFQRGLWWDGRFHPRLHHYRRLTTSEQTRPLISIRAPYDSFDGGDNGVTIKVVHTLDELMQAHAMRAAVFVSEQDCPYAEEFDGNDFAGTHLLAFSGTEPIGCVRIRYFADFAKIERLAVLAGSRRRGAGRALVLAAIEFCQMKGYRRVIAHARVSLTDFWSSLGFEPLEGASKFVFSGLEFIELGRSITPVAEALCATTDPYILIRPEGQWDRAGVLERHVGRKQRKYAAAA